MTPTGLEHPKESQRNHKVLETSEAFSEAVFLGSRGLDKSSQNAEDELATLIAAWPHLSPQVRTLILNLADIFAALQNEDDRSNCAKSRRQ